jgi:hypothetical protein
MKRQKGMVAVIALVVGFLGIYLWAQTIDSIFGTWELNLAKSKFASGAPPKSSTRTYVPDGDGHKYTNRGVDAEGKSTLVQYTAHYDGKDYPMTGNPESDTISLKHIDMLTSESIQKKAGVVVYRNRRVISKDGKVMTITTEGKNARGETFTNILVFDKR